MKSILSAYPQEVGASVRELYPSHLAEIESMKRRYQQSQEALWATIRPLPEQAQADFNKVIGMPEAAEVRVAQEGVDSPESLVPSLELDSTRPSS